MQYAVSGIHDRYEKYPQLLRRAPPAGTRRVLQMLAPKGLLH